MACVHMEAGTTAFTVALFVIVKDWEETPKYPSTEECVKKLQFDPTVE